MLMYVFPVMFAVFGINFPVGVLVYWLTTNVWTMGQQMYVIQQQPDPGQQGPGRVPGAAAQAASRCTARPAAQRARIVKAIVAKGRDRNEYERKFINGLTKAGLAAQADGTVVKSEAGRRRGRGRHAPAVPQAPAAQAPEQVAAPGRQREAAEERPSRDASQASLDEAEDAQPKRPSRSRRQAGVRLPAARPSPDSARARSGPRPRPRSKKESIP